MESIGSRQERAQTSADELLVLVICHHADRSSQKVELTTGASADLRAVFKLLHDRQKAQGRYAMHAHP